MKKYGQANVQILFDLFSWKKRAGASIRFEIVPQSRFWIISFISYDQHSPYEHIFASFMGDTHDELYSWALDLLTDFTIQFDKNAVSFPIPDAVNTPVSTPALQ